MFLAHKNLDIFDMYMIGIHRERRNLKKDCKVVLKVEFMWNVSKKW